MRSTYSSFPRSILSMITIWLLVLMVLPIFPVRTMAFMPTNSVANRASAGGSATHESITFDVIKAYDKDLFQLGNKDLTKNMKKAQEEIVNADTDVDSLFGEQFHQSASHFDGENFSGSQKRLMDYKLKVKELMLDKKPNASKARWYLGQALHTLQDFYAHSNWVDSGRGAPFNILGVPNNPMSNPSVDLRTCTDCSRDTCTDCYNPATGLTNLTTSELTTGYYGGDDRPKPNDFKCSHGGKVSFLGGLITSKDDSSKGAIGSGINKDTTNCTVSPHSDKHGLAANVAKQATKKYLDEIKTLIQAPKMKVLLGGGTTLAMAIDTTGSMGGIIAQVKQEAIQIVDSRIGTDEEPNKYVLVPFNDPDVGPVTVTDDPVEFKTAVSGLNADGGDDCPEFSVTGMLEGVNAIDEDGGELMMFTDASSKDGSLKGTVDSIALSKDIKIEERSFGSCSPIDPAYIQLANDTGGQLFSLSPDEAGTITQLADFIVRRNVVDVAYITTELTGVVKTYDVPVDSTMTSVTFSISGTSDVVVKRPDNSVVQPTDANVHKISVSSGAVYSVTSPAVGTWHVTVNGTGPFSLRAIGESQLDFSFFDFVELQGRPLHEGFFRIAGFPQLNQTASVLGQVSTDANTAHFELRNADGTSLQSLSLDELDWATEDDPDGAPVRQFMGDITTPATPFRAYVTGLDRNGVPYQRVRSGITIPQSLKITPPQAVDLTPGQSTSYIFKVTNLGAAGTFNVSAADDNNFLGTITPSTLTLGTNETADVAVLLQPGADAGDAALDTLTVTVQSTSAYNYARVKSVVKPTSTVALETLTAKESSGNGNGVVDAGESGTLDAALYNLGDNTASGVHITVTTSTPGVTIQTGTSAYPDIESGRVVSNSTPLTFSLGPDTVCGQHIDFTFTITGAGTTKVLNVPVQVGQTSTAKTPTTVSYTGPPVAIPDGNSNGVDVPLVVSGFTGAIADLDFSFDGSSCTAAAGAQTVGLDHTWVGDLIVTLISPQGKRAVLINRPGFGNDSGNNFCNTLLNDESTGRSIQDLVPGDEPNTGSFKPASPLSAFQGENPNGTWILHVSDEVGSDIGSVRAFSLHVSTLNCDTAPGDTTPPTCDLLTYYPGPPTSIDVGVQDIDSGFASIVVSESDNVSVNIPSFVPGNTAQLIVNAALLDQSRDGFIELTLTDRAGNVTVCDPVMTMIDRSTGQPSRKKFNGIAQTEHNVTVRNDNFGLAKLDIVVNGTTFHVTALHPNQIVYLDISRALRPGNNNTVEIVGFGPPGSRAAVLITD